MASGDGASDSSKSPPPAVGATLIAASVVVLVIGLGWLSRGSSDEQLAVPVVDGVTLPTDSDGDAVEVPPSQPATAVSFGTGGEILRPDPVRARVVDEDGDEIIVPLAPNTTVDTTTGEIVPRAPGTTTRPGGTTTPTGGTPTTRPGTPTTRPSTTPTTRPTTTAPPTTDPPPPTTDPPPPTTDPPPPTTDPPPPTTDPPPPDPEPTILDDLLGLVLP